MRAVRQVRELLELFTQSELADTGSTGDVEEYKREPATLLFASALFAVWVHMVLVASNQSIAGVIALKLLCLVCSDVAVSSDARYHTPAILQVLIKIKNCQNSHQQQLLECMQLMSGGKTCLAACML